MNDFFHSIQQSLIGIVRLFTNADEFRNPVWLWLLIVLPVFLVWYTYRFANKRLLAKLSYDPEKLAKPKFNLNFLRFVPLIFQICGLALLILSMARPQSTLTYDLRLTQGIDIMLVLDVSKSMETNDFKPNRLKIAKETAIKFVEGREHDRIGVIAFAEDAITHVPLTLDYDLVKKQIGAMSTKMLPNQGTAVGSAIATGINRMLSSNNPSKIMILLTDGASNRGQITPMKAAELAKEQNIKVYTIAIGKEMLDQQTEFGSFSSPTDLDEPTLQKIAANTNGKFFRCTDQRSLPEIFEKISGMEKMEIKDERYKEVTDAYPILIIWGICFFAGAFLIMVSFLYNPFEG